MRAQRHRSAGQRFGRSMVRAAGCAVVASLVAPVAAQAADIVKANNTTTLTTSTSWVGGVLPAASAATGGAVTSTGDFGVWNNTVTAANSVSIGSGFSVGGIKVVDPGGLVTITGSGSSTLTWGVLGIDMSAATQDLTITVPFFRTGPNAGATRPITIASGRTLTINGAGTVQGGSNTININGPGNLIYNGNWSGTLGLNITSGTTTLNGVNSFTNSSGSAGQQNGVGLSGGAVLVVNNDAALNGSRFDFGTGTLRNTTSGVNIQQSTVRILGAAVVDGTNSVSFAGIVSGRNGSRSIQNDISGSGTLSLNGLLNLSDDTAAAVRTFTITGAGSTIINGLVQDGTGAGSSLAKSGTGSLTITGSNNYTGSTNVNSGTLLVNNSGGSATGSGTVNINGGIVKGTGSIGGPVVVNSGGTLAGSLTTGNVTVNSGGIVSPGNSIGTLNASGLNLAGGTLNFEFAGSGAHDQLNVTSADQLIASGTNTLNLSSDGSGAIPSNTYTLIDYSGTALTDLSAFTLGTLPLRTIASLVNNTGNTSVDVQLTTDAPKWVGNAGNTWDINSTVNWKEIISGNATTYLQNGAVGDTVLFDNSAVNGNVVVSTTVSPASIEINNTSLAYNFTGTGKISGATGITKKGTGTATIGNTGGNDFTGVTSIEGGTLATGASDVLSNGSAINISNGAILGIGANSDATGAVTLIDGSITGSSGVLSPSSIETRKGTIAAHIGGATSLVKTTSDAVTLAAAGSYSAGTAIQEGTLVLGIANALPSTTLVNLGSGNTSGTLDLNGNATTVAGLTTSGSGFSNTVTSASPATLTLGGAGTAIYGGAIAGSIALVKSGTGTQLLTGSNSFSGGTTIAGGTLNVNSSAALGADGVTFTGGTLQTTTGVDFAARNFVTSGASANFDVTSGNSTTVSGVISGDGGLTKNSGGQLVLFNANTYAGATAINGGFLFAGNSGALNTSAVSINGGILQLGNGVSVANNISLSNSTTDGNLDVPNDGATATFAGNVSVASTAQFRPAATGAGATLVLTGNAALSSGRIIIVPRGNVVVAGSGVLSTSSASNIGRQNNAAADASLTAKDNASVSFNGGVGLGGGTSGTGNTNLNSIKLNVQDSATVNVTGNLDIANASGSNLGSSVNLNGGTLTVGGITKSTPGIASTINFNGGTLKANAANVNFLPALGGTTAQIQNGGAIIDDGGFAVQIAQPLVVATGSTGALVKRGTGVVTLASSFSGNDVKVQAGTLAAAARSVTGGNRPLYATHLSIDPSALLDLKDNDLVVHNGNYNDIRTQVLNGFGAPTPGSITSSTTDGSQILALFDNALVGAGDWLGGTIGPNAIVGKYTYFGDVNFDGQVTGDDYTIIDSNLNTTPPTGFEWLSGDANLDGIVTGDDYTTIDSNLGLGSGNPLSASSIAGDGLRASTLTAVPEPTAMALLLPGAGLLCARRRRRNR